MPTELKFQVSLLAQVGGGGVGGWKVKIKLNSTQLEMELGNKWIKIQNYKIKLNEEKMLNKYLIIF